LRRSWRSAGLVALAAALGLAVALPGLSLRGLRFQSVRDGGWSISWSGFLRDPGDAQQHAVNALAGVTRATALTLLVVVATSVLALSLARARARRADMRVRRAVGASRGVLAGACLLEGSIIALAGSSVGVATALLGWRAQAAAWPGFAPAPSVAGAAVVLLASIAVVVLGALLPLAYARGTAVAPAPGGQALWLPIPAVQFGLGLTALVLAGQLARAAHPAAGPEAAARGDHTVIAVTPADTSRAARTAAYARLLDRLAGSPHGASLTSPGALVGLGAADVATMDCGQCPQGGIMVPHRLVPVVHHLVSADTFRSIGLPVVAGRGIAAGDTPDRPPVAVVNRALARRHFQDGNAVGRLIRIGRGADPWHTVVGIVADRTPLGFGGAGQPPYSVYLSVLQHPPRTADLLVSGADARRSAAAVEATLGAGTAVAPVPLAGLVARERAPARWFAGVVRATGWAALAAAVLGMFGVMRLWIAGRMPELVLRRAVGATRARVLGFVVVRALAVAGAGAAVAWWLGPMVSDAAARAIPGLPGWDVRFVVIPWALLAAATAVGAVAPAWSAVAGRPAAMVERDAT
jgi:hypothetical protein